ncbi:MAG: hypothetical protein AB1505_12700 [Candidatus Latescibacterota bacterium]
MNSKNFMNKSAGTEAFIAEFDRLAGKCVRAAAKGPRAPVRQALELLLALLRRIDEDPDRVVFFADEAGSWQVGVNWREVLPAYGSQATCAVAATSSRKLRHMLL